MKNKILDALYHIRKEQAVQSYCLNPERSLFNSDTIYALANDCFPYFSPRSAEFKEYEDVFRVKKAFVDQVWDFISAESDENRFHTYYELETQFGGKDHRIELMTTLRYAFLAGQLDYDKFWEKLVENGGCPIEANNLNKSFELSELCLFRY